MKSLIILGALLLPLISVAQNTTGNSAEVSEAVVSADQLVKKEGLYFLADSEAPFSGTIRELYPSGYTKSENSVVNGIADSTVSEWYANGEPKGDEAQDMPASKITVSLLAGKSGEKGGGDGIGSEARFWDLRGAVMDDHGRLFLLDGNIIRAVFPNGTVRKVKPPIGPPLDPLARA